MKKLQALGVVLAALLVGMSTTVVVAATESSDG